MASVEHALWRHGGYHVVPVYHNNCSIDHQMERGRARYIRHQPRNNYWQRPIPLLPSPALSTVIYLWHVVFPMPFHHLDTKANQRTTTPINPQCPPSTRAELIGMYDEPAFHNTTLAVKMTVQRCAISMDQRYTRRL